MTSSVYYPRTLTTLGDLSDQLCPKDESSDAFRQRFLSINGGGTVQDRCAPARPVVVPSAGQSHSVSLGPLKGCTAEEQGTLAELSHYAGGAAVMGTARLVSQLRLNEIMANMMTYGGGGISAAAALSDKVLSSIHYYDHVNAEYQKLKNHRAAPSTLRTMERVVQRAFDKMNRELHARSLNYLNNTAFGMRQTTTVTGRQAWESIPVADAVDVQRLSRFAKAARIAGPGVVVLDGGLRTHTVYNAWQSGNPEWKRTAVVEGGSFALGIGAGVAVGLALAITPVGLVLGIVAGGAAAVGADNFFKRLMNMIYDAFGG